jgi:glutamate formiminotransferase
MNTQNGNYYKENQSKEERGNEFLISDEQYMELTNKIIEQLLQPDYYQSIKIEL